MKGQEIYSLLKVEKFLFLLLKKVKKKPENRLCEQKLIDLVCDKFFRERA